LRRTRWLPGAATYRIEIASRVLKQIQKLEPQLQERIPAAIDTLARATAARVDQANRRTVYVAYKVGWDYRVVYDIYGDFLVIDVVRVAHRRNAYKGHA